jgi:hypothetical protein
MTWALVGGESSPNVRRRSERAAAEPANDTRAFAYLSLSSM